MSYISREFRHARIFVETSDTWFSGHPKTSKCRRHLSHQPVNCGLDEFEHRPAGGQCNQLS